MEEIWKDIKGYENLYQVSNLGRVRSLWFGKIRLLKECVNGNGYNHVILTKDGKSKVCLIHRLVAFAFIPNHNNLKEVNHKDEDKSNNCVDNLEWCTHLYNMNYGCRNEKASKKLTNRKDLSKSVLQFTKDGQFVAEYQSFMDAERKTGIYNESISACCLGKRKSAGGYIWKQK